MDPQPGAGLVIEAGPSVSPLVSGAGAYGIRVQDVAHVTVQGLRVQGFNVASVRLANAPDAVLQNNLLQGAGAGAIEAIGCDDLHVLGNDLAPNAGTAALLRTVRGVRHGAPHYARAAGGSCPAGVRHGALGGPPALGRSLFPCGAGGPGYPAVNH